MGGPAGARAAIEMRCDGPLGDTGATETNRQATTKKAPTGAQVAPTYGCTTSAGTATGANGDRLALLATKARTAYAATRPALQKANRPRITDSRVS